MAVLFGDLNLDPLMILYPLPLAVVWIVYLGLRKKAEWRNIAKRRAAAEAGLLEPPTLHPEIDPSRCIGCGACVRACPEARFSGSSTAKRRSSNHRIASATAPA